MPDRKDTFLDPRKIRLWRPAPHAKPRGEILGEVCILQVRLAQCFPLSAPQEYISIQDGAGTEIGILKNLEGLDPESRKIIQEELDRKYFTPFILRILSLRQEASTWRWEVQTQRGPATFYIRGVRDSIHEVAPGRWQIISLDGQRYEIRDYAKLDAKSQLLFDSLF